ncbi:hypothetical protein [Halostagnicola sp. A-GB9-2]|uniref:hypothetical protein n=1 Tax=Halostagnicola sp. A-GB9-2 TaxID=3048066 RepID=UPI0024BF732E|nr:hypothetical protein [Halostagnicola sp. A-GB9-2]MDJ1431319.1 hypothetical protein [Halostagnicola sp. A-GB9-2]
MSKLLVLTTRIARRGAKVRRTIRHSPEFGNEPATTDDGRPAKHCPPGGFITG